MLYIIFQHYGIHHIVGRITLTAIEFCGSSTTLNHNTLHTADS